GWALAAAHVTDGRAVLMLAAALGPAVFFSAVVAALYLALEPVVRKRWPWRLVGWNRLLAGRVRDPLVGRDVLVGLAAGVVFSVALHHATAGPAWAPALQLALATGEYEFDPTHCVLTPLTTGVTVGFLYFFLVFLSHWVCRDYRLGSAVVLLVVLASASAGPAAAKPVTHVLTVFVAVLGLQFVALRFGLLAFVAAMLPYGWLNLNGWSLDVRAWYATGPNLGVAVMLALTLYAAYTACGGWLRGRPGRD